MELHMLGPVELWADGRRHTIGSPVQRRILAFLALNVRQTIPIDTLIDRLWSDDPPTRPTIHSYVARLRTALHHATDAAGITFRDRGYVLDTDPELIDVHRFRTLRVQADSLAESGQYDEAAALMREAAALRKGRPLDGLRGAWAERTRMALDQDWLGAAVSRSRIERHLGRHAALAGELTGLVAEHPFHEGLLEELMRALYGCGEAAHALEVYRRERRRFTDELGTEPGPRVREVQRRILAGDLDGAAVRGERPPAEPPRPPDNLPRALADFVGREPEIADVLAARSPGPERPCGVVAIDGMPGVGKSALAVHLAHRVAASYPDARVYLDLGANGARDPLDPPIALARLLRMIGVPDDEVPPSLDARADLWRARLADRRAVVVLDDAADDDQVRYLLPGSSPSLVIVTSRRRLSGLDGVRPITLGVLSPDDATRMLHGIITAEQAADDAASATVIRRCGALPLAIRLAAIRLRDRPARTVRDLAGQLEGVADVLGELRAGDRSVRIAFELSYRALPEPQRRVFRLLGLHTGTEFTLDATAALLDLPHDAVVGAIDALLDHNLLEERSRDGYRFHDLLRGYARERAEAEDGAAARAACLDRLGAYYLALAEHGEHRKLESELTGILGYAQQEHRRFPAIAHAVAPFLETTARWNEAIDIHWRAIRTCRDTGDRAGEAAAMVDLALVDLRCGRYAEAEDVARAAASTCRTIGDAHGEAAALDRLGLAHWYQTAFARALDNFDAAVTRYGRLGDRKGEADALAHSAMALFHLGRYDTSILISERALNAYRALGHRRGEIEALTNIAETQMRLGRHHDALENHLRSARLSEGGAPQDAAIDLANIGACRLALGQLDEAFRCLRDALGIYREIGDRTGMAEVMNHLGTAYRKSGRRSEALIHHQNALKIARDAAEPMEECRAIRHIGAIQTDAGKYRTALGHLDEALEIAHRIGDPYEVGLVLNAQGEALHRAHRHPEARDRWTEAARVLRDLGLADATRIEERLREFRATGS